MRRITNTSKVLGIFRRTYNPTCPIEYVFDCAPVYNLLPQPRSLQLALWTSTNAKCSEHVLSIVCRPTAVDRAAAKFTLRVDL